MKRQFSGIMTLLVVLISLQVVYAQAETTITECDYQHVSKAVATGGSIILDCDRNIQIWANKPLTITSDTTIKPAEGRTVSFEALKGRAFVVNKDATFTLSDMTLKGNANERGGGIENNGGKLLISNMVFDRNDSNPGGALINNKGGSVIIESSSFSHNQSPGGSGGAIYNDDAAQITITSTTFTQNKSLIGLNASGGGGGAIYNLGKMDISGSLFSANIAEGIPTWGGAILNTQNAVLTVSNSTFIHNSAYQNGGAIHNDTQAETAIQFSTFVENGSTILGSALYIEGGKLTVTNSLFSGNMAGKKESDCAAAEKMGVINATNNLSNAGCGETAATGVANLGDNGGLTLTVAIASNSNAVDAASECPTSGVDQRGTARPQGKACDIGAYEFVELKTAATSVSLCQVTTTRDVRLRTEPNTASSVLAVVPHALTFQAIEQVTGWYHITYGTVDGWLSADFVTTKGACSG